MMKEPNRARIDEEFIRADERTRHEEWLCRRLSSWLGETPRRPAVSAFTAGPLRDVAREIERALAAGKGVRETEDRHMEHDIGGDDDGFDGRLYLACKRVRDRGDAACRAVLAAVGIVLDDRDRLIAVGPSPEATALAWGKAARQTVDSIHDVERESDGRFDWSLRFAADGDSMKAAGITLPHGGCVMTWLK